MSAAFPRNSLPYTSANCPRFVALSNFSDQSCDPTTRLCFPLPAAVLDRETGLVWERSPDPTHRNRRLAASACHDKIIGGRKGWRLPTISELASLVDPHQDSPALPEGAPVRQRTVFASRDFPDAVLVVDGVPRRTAHSVRAAISAWRRYRGVGVVILFVLLKCRLLHQSENGRSDGS